MMSTSDETQLTLDRFKRLPKRFQNKSVDFIVTNEDDFTAVDAEDCRALKLPIGDTVFDYLEIPECGSWYLYASKDTAAKLVDVEKFATLRIWATTRYGEKTDTQWTDHGPREEKSTILGLLVERFEHLTNIQ